MNIYKAASALTGVLVLGGGGSTLAVQATNGTLVSSEIKREGGGVTQRVSEPPAKREEVTYTFNFETPIFLNCPVGSFPDDDIEWNTKKLAIVCRPKASYYRPDSLLEWDGFEGYNRPKTKCRKQTNNTYKCEWQGAVAPKATVDNSDWFKRQRGYSLTEKVLKIN
ncbi:hypothetical protein MHLP_01150 [Candidatus Mycoplasma haematolamae str. Purdue]|uniref:Uncharacterized protein n=1 Tax=Mycoplasma haematolamae (strain Purdue) TaxID=1212765 RepID=I7B962_MYCHA|nr:hypothetical protein [Candidatus Mycoplasma haematolamae]AFO51810.1 hypothetical protein MHLP_01150 [Candidatus Mycoplasma haematolamae str. Purdue]